MQGQASDPSDSDLAAGRMYYQTGVGIRWYSGTSWYTIPTTSGGGTLNTWDEMYALDKTLTINGTTLTFNLTHATGDGLTLSSGAVAGALLQFANSGSGADIQGTGDTWSVSKAGLVTCVGLTTTSDLTSTGAAIDWDLIDNNASALSIDTAGLAGLIAIVTTNASEGVTMSGLLTVAGVLTASTGLASSDGTCTFTDNSNAANGLVFVNDTVTTFGNATDEGPIHFSSVSLTTGHLLTLSLKESEVNGGSYIRCWGQDAAAAHFTVGELGLTTIAGSALGTDALILTAGDILVTSGNIDITAGDFAMGDGSVTVVDADNAASLSVTNSTATSESPFVFVGAGAFTGTTTKSWMTKTAAGLQTGTQEYMVAAALTQGKMLHMVSGATLTSGTMLYVQNTGNDSAMTSGQVAFFDHTAAVIASSVNKIGSVVSVTSNRTINTGGTTADDFDLLSLIKTTTRTAGTAATAGSVLYIGVVTTGTVTETSHGIEVVMDSGGTGSGLEVTHAATGGKILDLVGASTSVDDVLITGSGAHTSNLATLQVTNSGNTAAAGSILRIAQSGTPTATSYLVEFTNEHATVSSNPMLVQMNNHTSTNAVLNITSAGTNTTGLAVITSTNGGANGSILAMHHLGGSQADNDYVAQILFGGEDASAAANEYGAIKCQVNAKADGSEDGRLELWVSVGGTNTEVFAVESTSAGAKDCEIKTATCTLDGSAAGTTALTITNGDLSLSAGGFDSTTTADIYGLDVTVNHAAATQGVARFVNASTTSAIHVLELSQADVDEPYMKFSGATAITSANAGANGDVPAQVAGYLMVDIDGTDRKIPYYAT